jgi:hypothetical protein
MCFAIPTPALPEEKDDMEHDDLVELKVLCTA